MAQSKSKVFVNLVGFNNERAIDAAIYRFRRLTETEGLEIIPTLFDVQYPLTTSDLLLNVAAKHHWRLAIEPKNLGQTGNFNRAFQYCIQAGAKPGDAIAFWDCDNAPSKRNWLQATVDVMATDPRIGYVTPTRKPDWVLGNQGEWRTVAGHRMRHVVWPGGFPMAVYSAKFAIDKVSMPQSRAFYGGTEADALMALSHCDSYGLMFADIEDYGSQEFFDAEYTSWKVDTIHKESGAQVDFVDWLKARQIKGRR